MHVTRLRVLSAWVVGWCRLTQPHHQVIVGACVLTKLDDPRIRRMPPRTRRSNAETVYISQQPRRQETFIPRKETRRPKPSPDVISSEKKKQQTLTQIKFPILPLSDDDDDVQSDRLIQRPAKRKASYKRAEQDASAESGSDWERPSASRKRRRISLEPPLFRSSNKVSRRSLGVKEQGQQTLTQAGYLLRGVLGETSDPEDDGFDILKDDDETGIDVVEGSQDTEDPPQMRSPKPNRLSMDTDPKATIAFSKPCTPRHRKTLEVPSSQSPADVPLSTQSSRSLGSVERSPLKERSPNLLFSRRKCGNAKLFSELGEENETGGRMSLESSHEFVSPRNERTRHQESPWSSEDNDISEGLSTDRYPTSNTPLTSSAPLPDNSSAFDAKCSWNNLVTPTALPQPCWSQLEHRDITQYAGSQATEIDGPSVQLLQDVRDATQRVVSRSQAAQHMNSEGGDDTMQTFRHPQVSTGEQNNAQALSPFSSSLPRTSPSLERKRTMLWADEDADLRLPSSPQLMPPPFRRRRSVDQDLEESQRTVTFTQLVPESLRDLSHHLRPIWTQEED